MPNTNVFSLEEINQILEQLNAHQGARLQYIGSRYVPIFGRKGESSIEWDNSGTYEPLTIVLYQGNSYTSRQFVPVGVEITNEEYWAETGNYNAQIEQYRKETQQNTSDISTLQTQMGTANGNISELQTQMGTANGNISELQTQMSTANENIEKITQYNKMLVIGDSWSDPDFSSDVSGKWVDYLAESISFETVQNISESGIGFAHKNANGYNFAGLLQAKLSSITDKESVTHIIIYGGLNDVTYSEQYSDISKGVNNLLSIASQNFPYAKIHLVGINAERTLMQTMVNMAPLICMAERATQYDNVFFHNSDSWFATRSDFLGSNSHPSLNGNKTIALYMTKVLNNEPCGISGWAKLTITNATQRDIFCPIIDNKLIIKQINLGENLTTGTVGSLTTSIFNFPTILIPLCASTNNEAGWMQIGASNIMVRVPSGTDVYIPQCEIPLFI